jgi:AmmeMemoRadiSam system protein B/AmmeMemoRadiSam system protein A
LNFKKIEKFFPCRVKNDKFMTPAMKHMRRLCCKVLPAVYLACLLSAGSVYSGEIRKPVYAGSFYPARPSELTNYIEQLTNQIKSTQIQHPPKASLRAIIMPHAGYIYSGLTAAHASLVLRENQFNRIVMLGPDHRVGFTGGAISDANAYETPLGLTKIHEDAGKLLRLSPLFKSIPISDKREHSLEVVLPFLQHYLKAFELIPIVLGPGNIDRYASTLDPLLDDRTLLVVSSDLSHYLPYSEAVAKDEETIQTILNLDVNQLVKRDNVACGKIPILITMAIARRNGWHPVFLHYSNSGDTAGDRSRVVGYTVIAFYGGTPMQHETDSSQPFSKHQGQILISIARQTIADRLGQQSIKVDTNSLSDNAFQEKRGTFVTLTTKGQLRGCIGSLEAGESILTGVKRNAINAAFHDPRFSPLKADELDKVDIEISILSQPQPLKYSDSKDLLSKLRVKIDGVVLRKGSSSATFLPQVWEQLPQPKQFLSHLCLKAGLSADTWKNQPLEISTYQVQYFEEEK